MINRADRPESGEGVSSTSTSGPLRVRTIEVLWHCNDRGDAAEMLGMQSNLMEGITSVDYHPRCDRLVTTGGDGNIRLWELNTPAIDAWLENSAKNMLACCRHLCRMRTAWMPLTARWSPHGELIASAHCDGKVCLWWRDAAAQPSDRDGNGDVEEWKAYRHLTGHLSDVYDLAFSPDSRYLLSGAGDGSIVIHDLTGSTMPTLQLPEVHSKFCRGVAWDPWSRYLHTFGSGPALLCFTHVPQTKGVSRRMLLADKRRCKGDFIGESCALSYRRLGWSPDGLLLAVPYGKYSKASLSAGEASSSTRTAELLAAIDAKNRADTNPVAAPMCSTSSSPSPPSTISVLEEGKEEDMLHCVYLYSRGAPDKIAARLAMRGFSEVRGVLWAPCFLETLPCVEEGANAGRTRSTSPATAGPSTPSPSCSSLEETRNQCGSWGPAEYRMALAAWTTDAVIVYTTDSSTRHSDFTDLHMRGITDLAWSPNASHLYTASLDGYISVIAFGGSLAVAHRLPTFSSSSVVKGLCTLLENMEKTGLNIEGGRSSSGGSASRSAEDSCASQRQKEVAAAAAPTVVVRKKKKVEKKDVDMQQLADLMSAV